MEGLLHNHADNGNFEELKRLIDEQINSKDQDQRTLLHKASEQGNLMAVQYLIQVGAQLEAKDRNGNTPLLLATTYEVTACLIQNGAQVNVSDINGQTPLHLSYTYEITALLIQNGAQVNAIDVYGRTPLHLTDIYEIAAYLIQNGAQVNAIDEEGKTPLHLADTTEIIEYLIRNGAQVNAIDEDGKTPLHLTQSSEIATCLIQNGAQVNAIDEEGNTPLHLAQTSEIATCLIQNGAQVAARREYGVGTPLHAAAFSNNVDVIRCLLFYIPIDAKCHSKWTYDFGWTPLHFSAINGSLDAAKYLVEHGAQINARTDKNETSFDLANQHGFVQVAKYLLEMKKESESQNPQENASNKDLCIICQTPKNGFYVLNPCGHANLCEPCCFTLNNENTNGKCPSCRMPISGYQKIFF